MTINERIRILRKELKLSGEDFGKAIGLKRNSLSQIENGINNCTEQTLLLICKTYNVNEQWLRDGVGEMFKKDPLSELKEKYQLSDVMMEIVEAYLSLPTNKQAVIDEMVENLLKNPTKNKKDC